MLFALSQFEKEQATSDRLSEHSTASGWRPSGDQTPDAYDSMSCHTALGSPRDRFDRSFTGPPASGGNVLSEVAREDAVRAVAWAPDGATLVRENPPRRASRDST